MMWYLIAFLCAAAGAGLNANNGDWGWAVFLSLLAISNLALLVAEESS